MLTVPVCADAVSIETPFCRRCRMMSLTAVTLSVSVSVAPSPSDRNRLPLVCTRPPKLKFGPAKNERSTSEKMPNWNTGIATDSTSRVRCASPLAVDLATTSSRYSFFNASSP